MSESTADARRNISEWEARRSTSWPMTAELIRDALNALNIPAGRLTELLLRYIGEHEDEPALARMLTTESPWVSFLSGSLSGGRGLG